MKAPENQTTQMSEGSAVESLPDEAYLAMIVYASRKEQGLGYKGWLKYPAEAADSVQRLIKRKLIISDGSDWVMPTEAGFAEVEREGHA